MIGTENSRLRARKKGRRRAANREKREGERCEWIEDGCAPILDPLTSTATEMTRMCHTVRRTYRSTATFQASFVMLMRYLYKITPWTINNSPTDYYNVSLFLLLQIIGCLLWPPIETHRALHCPDNFY